MRPPLKLNDPSRTTAVPGPKYLLPQNLTATGSKPGFAYSFGSRVTGAKDSKTDSPGPKYVLPRNLTATGSKPGLAYSFGCRTNILSGSRTSIPGPIYSVRGNPLKKSPSNSGCTFGAKHTHRRRNGSSPSRPVPSPRPPAPRPARRAERRCASPFSLGLRILLHPSLAPSPPRPLAPVRALLLTPSRFAVGCCVTSDRRYHTAHFYMGSPLQWPSPDRP